MSRRSLLRDGQQRDALAVRLRQLVDQFESLADLHCETLDFLSYVGLGEHAAELKGALRVLVAKDLEAECARLVSEAEQHIAFTIEDHGAAP